MVCKGLAVGILAPANGIIKLVILAKLGVSIIASLYYVLEAAETALYLYLFAVKWVVRSVKIRSPD